MNAWCTFCPVWPIIPLTFITLVAVDIMGLKLHTLDKDVFIMSENITSIICDSTHQNGPVGSEVQTGLWLFLNSYSFRSM